MASQAEITNRLVKTLLNDSAGFTGINTGYELYYEAGGGKLC